LQEPAARPAKWAPALSGNDNEGMNRLLEVLEQFPLPELSRLLRRTIFSAIGLGAVALIVATALGYVLFGLGVCIGLGLGVANIRLVTKQATTAGASQSAHPVRALASQAAFRLSLTTAAIIVLVLVSNQLGFGAVGGIAVFYFAFLGNLIVQVMGKGFVA